MFTPEPEPEQAEGDIREDDPRGMVSNDDLYEAAPVFAAAPEETREEPVPKQTKDVLVTPPSPPPAAPVLPPAVPVVIAAPAPARVPTPAPVEPAGPDLTYLEDVNAELESKYKEATLEIERLQALLASAPDPTSLAPSEVPSGVRRRGYALSDDGTSTFDDGASSYDDRTDVGTAMTDVSSHTTEGVPLQVVLIISIGVFITTYLFF